MQSINQFTYLRHNKATETRKVGVRKFRWEAALEEAVRDSTGTSMSVSMDLLAEQPLPLTFWYRTVRLHTNTFISLSSEPRGLTHEIISCAVPKKSKKMPWTMRY